MAGKRGFRERVGVCLVSILPALLLTIVGSILGGVMIEKNVIPESCVLMLAAVLQFFSVACGVYLAIRLSFGEYLCGVAVLVTYYFMMLIAAMLIFEGISASFALGLLACVLGGSAACVATRRGKRKVKRSKKKPHN